MSLSSYTSPDIVARCMRPGLTFPKELWGMTISDLRERTSQDELAYLWMTVRLVSGFIKHEIETIFVLEHMKKVFLHADCGTSLFAIPTLSHPQLYIKHFAAVSFSNESDRGMLGVFCGQCQSYLLNEQPNPGSHCGHPTTFSLADIILEFSHYVEGNVDMAVFKMDSSQVPKAADMRFRAICHTLSRHDCNFPGLGNFDTWTDQSIMANPTYRPESRGRPVFIVQVGSGFYESAMPLMKVNMKAQELSVQWKLLLTSAFDHKEKDDYYKRSVSSNQL